MSDEQTNLAQVKDLSVSFMTDAGSIKAIDKISFTIPRKTVVGVVGESGSGKSVTARSIIKLLPETATTSGMIYLSNREGNEQLDVCLFPEKICAVCEDQKRPWCSRNLIRYLIRCIPSDGKSKRDFARTA